MKTTTTKAAEGRKKAATKAAEPKTAEQTTNATKTAEKAEERKEEKTMKKNATNAANAAPKTEAVKTAEQTAAAVKAVPVTEAVKATPKAAEESRLSERIRAALEAAKTANTPNARKENAEKAAALILEFNTKSIAAAVNRATFAKAAEALKPHAPKKDESRRAGFTYANAESIITYQYMDEEGHESTRTLSLITYAVNAFMKTATKAAHEAFAACLAELEKVNAAAVEGREENGKNAAAVLTTLAKACGLDTFAEKTAEDGKKYPFYVDRSFVYAAAAPLRVKRGEVKTAAATLEAATLATLEASEARRARAEGRRVKAEAAAVKAVFGIIAAAAEAAAVNVWKAYVKTAEGVREDWKKAAEAAAKREAEQAAKKKAREAKKAEQDAKTAAAKREKAAKLREQAAALEAAAAEQDAKTAAA